MYTAGGGTPIVGLTDGATYYVHKNGLGAQQVQLGDAPGGSIIGGLSGGGGENAAPRAHQ